MFSACRLLGTGVGFGGDHGDAMCVWVNCFLEGRNFVQERFHIGSIEDRNKCFSNSNLVVLPFPVDISFSHKNYFKHVKNTTAMTSASKYSYW